MFNLPGLLQFHQQKQFLWLRKRCLSFERVLQLWQLIISHKEFSREYHDHSSKLRILYLHTISCILIFYLFQVKGYLDAINSTKSSTRIHTCREGNFFQLAWTMKYGVSPPSFLLVSCVGVLVWIGTGDTDKFSQNCKKDGYKRNSTLYLVKFVLISLSM